MASVNAIRQLPTNRPQLFLTFDDGPDEHTTSAILDCLEQNQAHASFFVVVQKAEAQRPLVEQILRRGHTLGNHSLDHQFRNFFRRGPAMVDWISQAEQRLTQLTGQRSLGFRPPAGVRTPHLLRALKQKQIPLILWNTRFYDSLWSWKPKAALSSLKRANAGDIILLHDRQRIGNRQNFLNTLDLYLRAGREMGFTFSALSAEECQRHA